MRATLRRLRHTVTLQTAWLALLIAGGLFEAVPPFNGLPEGAVVVAAGGCVALAAAFSYPTRRSVSQQAGLPLIALLCAFLLPLYWTAPATAYGQEKVVALFTLTALAAVAPLFLVRNGRDLKSLVIWLSAIGMIVGLVTLTGDTSAGRLVAPEGINPIWAARGVGIAVVGLAWWATTSRRWLPLMLTGVMLLPLLGLGSRGPVIAAAISIALMLLRLQPVNGWKNYVGVPVALIAALVMGVQVSPEESVQRLNLLVSNDPGIDSARKSLYYEVATMVPDNPLGVGWGEWVKHSATRFLYPHNVFFEVFAEAGWIPGTLFTALVLWMLLSTSRLAPGSRDALLLLGMLSFVVITAMFSGDINNRYLFSMIGVTSSLLPGMRRRSSRPR